MYALTRHCIGDRWLGALDLENSKVEGRLSQSVARTSISRASRSPTRRSLHTKVLESNMQRRISTDTRTPRKSVKQYDIATIMKWDTNYFWPTSFFFFFFRAGAPSVTS